MAVAFHPTKLNVFGSSSKDGTIKVWDIEKRAVTHTIQDHDIPQIYRLQFCLKSEKPLLVTGGDGGHARVWDYEAGSCVAKLEGHSGNVWDAFFHPHLPFIFTASFNREVRVWDELNYKLVLSYSTELTNISSMAPPCRNSNKIVLGGCTEFLVLEVVGKQTEVSINKILSMQRTLDELRAAQTIKTQSLTELGSMLQKEVTARQESDKACKELTARIQKAEVERPTLVEKLGKISQTVEKMEGKLKQVTERQVARELRREVGDGPVEDNCPLFREYSAKELQDATDNFDDKWKSGDGDP
ncbi:hypothetical protein CBR_g8700 [Chara braunii]|uniref:Uncharacterized protein n=1 Tax=Chara braunii TaxID=69332 RepID=A0A388KMQ8_CHABU|nr:hypothetical protein CBR_g8700 [Chara braunii]|eukprot:GBG71278.1 hypothetical protein CBR_g8700 [Chara braunii]